jgi:hypothetical protein
MVMLDHSNYSRDANHYNMLTTTSKRQATRPYSGETIGATPLEELEDTEEEVIERLTVEPLVEDAEFLTPDELED